MNTRFEYLLRLGDDALILGQQLGLWTGHGPVLEEDIALTNIGLDQIGQARAWLTLAGKGREAKGAMKTRSPFTATKRVSAMPSCASGPTATLATPLSANSCFDAYAVPLHAALAQSNDAEIAAIALKSAKESAYHLRHSRAWLVRLGDGTEESHDKGASKLDLTAPFRRRPVLF